MTIGADTASAPHRASSRSSRLSLARERLQEYSVALSETRGSAARAGADLLVGAVYGGESTLLVVQEVRSPSPVVVQQIAAASFQPVLLLADYVNRPTSESCRQLGVNFVDSAGNLQLRLPGLHVDIEGRPRAERLGAEDGSPAPQAAEFEQVAAPKRRPLRAFQPGGLRVLFALLRDPEAVAAPYRAIADLAGASNGTVQYTLGSLAELGYLTQGARGRRRLLREGELFQRWVEAFNVTLRPTLELGTFETNMLPEVLTGQVRLTTPGAQWGGEYAFSRLVEGVLRPSTALLYVEKMSPLLARELRLKRSAEGGVSVRSRFWPDEGGVTVPVELVYADLVSSGDPRQGEAARQLASVSPELRRLEVGQLSA